MARKFEMSPIRHNFNQTTKSFYDEQMRNSREIMQQLRSGKADLRKQMIELPKDFVPSPRPTFPNIKTAVDKYKNLRQSTKISASESMGYEGSRLTASHKTYVKMDTHML